MLIVDTCLSLVSVFFFFVQGKVMYPEWVGEGQGVGMGVGGVSGTEQLTLINQTIRNVRIISLMISPSNESSREATSTFLNKNVKSEW